jgi:LysR family nod box-dependent transcriptional activator
MTIQEDAVSEPLNLSRVDLNLLISLDALLTERSVTRAAEKLHLSQPALSASLSKLRRHFDDELLARHGNSYEPTPLALRLAEHTTSALESARRVFDAQDSWDPSSSTREFSIYGSDYAFTVIGPEVLRLASEQAPGVTFRFELHNPTIVEDAEAQLRTMDGLLLPHGHINGLPFEDLWTDGWMIIASADNPLAQRELTMEDLSGASWVFTFSSATAFTSAGRQIQQLGIEPRIDAVVGSFVALPWFVEGTDRLAMVQSSLAKPYLRHESGAAVVALKPPFEATPITDALWWHPVHEQDPEHQWMRGLFKQAAANLSYTVDSLPAT